MRNTFRYLTELALAAIILAAAVSAPADTEHFSHVTVTPPSGWTRTVAGGWLQFTPPNVPPGQTVAIQVSPGGPSSHELTEEFEALIKASANGMATVQQGSLQSKTDRQGLKVIAQSVVFQDASGKKLFHYFVGRHNGGRFEAVAYTASTPDLASQFASAMNAFVAGMVFDGAPNPNTQGPTPNTQQSVPSTQHPGSLARRAISEDEARRAPTQQPAPAIRFAPAAARPMYIIGQAALENGQPVPKFRVDVGGYNGKFNAFNNNRLGGPQVTQNGTTFANTEGANGRYSIHMTEDATMTKVRATAVFPFHGTNFTIDLWPTDNVMDGTGAADYRGRTKTGIVRNFVVKMDGIRPGYDPAKYPDHETNVTRDSGCYFGGTLVFSCHFDKPAPKNSVITITLTPNGPKIDGLPARTLVRTCPLDPCLYGYLYGIPYAAYTATAQLTQSGGAVHTLRLTTDLPLKESDWHPSATIEWCRWPNGTAKADGSIIIPVTVYLNQ